MKQIILIAYTVFSINTYAQVNLNWSQTQSLSGGTFQSVPIELVLNNSNCYVASNEYSDVMINGLITKYDANGILQWNLTVNPGIPIDAFPKGGIGGMWVDQSGDAFIAYNTDTSTSHLIKINSDGVIIWDSMWTGINNIFSGELNQNGLFLYGHTPLVTCGYTEQQCFGVAIGKFDFTGQLVWIQTNYANGGYFVDASDISLTNSGEIIVCGKKSTYTGSSNDRDPFILKYAPDGTFLWSKEFTDVSTDLPDLTKLSIDSNNNIYLAYTASDLLTSVKKCILIKLNAAGTIQFIKTVINAELQNLKIIDSSDVAIVSTTIGLKAYSTSGTLIWSNNFMLPKAIIGSAATKLSPWLIAKNVEPNYPLDYFLVQILYTTGEIEFIKNLSFGNHEEYSGDYIGIAANLNKDCFLLINNTIFPYGTKLTKLSQCSDFTYSFNASATITNISGISCNNGKIKFSLSGSFNSWPHIEVTDESGEMLASVDMDPDAPSYIFKNLYPGNYIAKVFDESCGEMSFNVSVKCPKPSSGFNATIESSTSVSLSWNASNCNNGYKVKYRKKGTIPWNTANLSVASIIITGLDPNTEYEWKVASNCINSNPVITSAYSEIQTFSMPNLRSGSEEVTYFNQIESNNEFDLNIYPNPTADMLTILIKTGVREIHMQIENSIGQTIFEELVVDDEQLKQMQVDVSRFPGGTYFLKVKISDRYICRKFIKQ